MTLRGHLQHMSYFCLKDTTTTQIYTLSLHDALPISPERVDESIHIRHRGLHDDLRPRAASRRATSASKARRAERSREYRSEEHTSELQSLRHLVCRLLLEKKKNTATQTEKHNNVRRK